MPLYPAHYLGDTSHLSTVEHGAYFLLILHYWLKGPPPADDRKLARIVRLSVEDWLEIRATVAEFFGPDWRHKRVDQELAKAEERYERRVAWFRRLDDRRPQPAEWVAIRSRIFQRDRFTCSYCGQVGGDLECDHILPVARGGGNQDSNLATACRACNRAKGTMTPNEWRAALS